MSQVIKCIHCSKRYEPYKNSKGSDSKICPSCRTVQQAAEARRPPRVRNYQAEAKRNLENNWIMFQRSSIEKRNKELYSKCF